MDLGSECIDPAPAIQEEVINNTVRAAAARTNSNLPGCTSMDLTNNIQEADHLVAFDADVIEDVDKDKEEEDNDYDVPPMIGWHDQDPGSNSES